MRSRFDLLVFDWDGTLMDSEAKIVRCFRNAVLDADVNYPGDAAVRSIIGLGLAEAVEQLLPLCGHDKRDAVIENYRQHFLFHDQTEMLFFPEVERGLDLLENHGYKLAVATGKARRGLDRLLTQWNMHGRFVATRCADEALSKPHPKMLKDILDATGTAPERALMIGDTTFDMEMALNAGVERLAVTYGVHSPNELLRYKPIECLDSFAEVRDWLTTEQAA